jgi:hypothetical protein
MSDNVIGVTVIYSPDGNFQLYSDGGSIAGAIIKTDPNTALTHYASTIGHVFAPDLSCPADIGDTGMIQDGKLRLKICIDCLAKTICNREHLKFKDPT